MIQIINENEMPFGSMDSRYFDFLNDIKDRIRKAQGYASVFVNSELVILGNKNSVVKNE